METVIENFGKRKYQHCLDAIDQLLLTDLSLLESVTLQNNKIVCQALKSIALNNVSRDVGRNFCALLNNCCALGCPDQVISLQLELTLVFNNIWWFLATTNCEVSGRHTFENVLQILINTCNRVSGDSISAAHLLADPTEAIIIKLKLLLDVITNKFPTLIETCLGIISLTLLCLLLFGYAPQNYLEFLQSILCKVHQFQALSSVRHLTDSDRSIFKLGQFSDVQNSTSQETLATINVLQILHNVASITLTTTAPIRPACPLLSSNYFCLQKYCEAFVYFKHNDLHASLGLLLECSSNVKEPNLQGRYKYLMGQIYSNVGDHQKAVECFSKASQFITSPDVFYREGCEFGKMGVYDLMLRSYKNMIKVMTVRDNSPNIALSLENRILQILHPSSEIHLPEALYILAVAYCVNEMFDESVETFEKILTPAYLSYFVDTRASDRIVKSPPVTTVLHEAATLFLLTGHLSQAEDVCKKAIASYSANPSASCLETDTHGTKDTEWIRSFLNENVGIITDGYPTAQKFYEDYISMFHEDVVGLMLLAEIQKIQESEETRLTLNQVLLILSKHIARMQKQNNSSKKEDIQLSLVKTLACKICLEIAKMQENLKPFQDVDKMYKRALSCNNGDKDVLHDYAQFLISSDRIGEAVKLWRTFAEKESSVNVNECQSLALRHLLRNRISPRHLQSLAFKLNTHR